MSMTTFDQSTRKGLRPPATALEQFVRASFDDLQFEWFLQVTQDLQQAHQGGELVFDLDYILEFLNSDAFRKCPPAVTVPVMRIISDLVEAGRRKPSFVLEEAEISGQAELTHEEIQERLSGKPWIESKPKDRARDRAIWELRGAGETVEKTAEAADCSPATVKNTYKRLKKLYDFREWFGYDQEGQALQDLLKLAET